MLSTLSRKAITLLACAAIPTAAHAEGLQVSPISVEITERSGVLRLGNESDGQLRAQVRVYRWIQADGEDRMVETDELIASPPFVQVGPEEEQVIRLVRFGDAALAMSECERSYRVVVDELPVNPNEAQTGLQYVLRYSVPVYLLNPACENAQPDLRWEIAIEGDTAWLNVVNSGQTRAQLATVSFIPASGDFVTIANGLLGYVLPQSERRFELAQPAEVFANGGQIEVTLNGAQQREDVALAFADR